MKFRFLVALMALTVAVSARSQADSLTVEGVVINTVDGRVLPMCHVQLLQGGRSMGIALTDYDGYFELPPLPAGSYTLLVTQFGDTMMCYKNLRLTRDSWLRSIVAPPTGAAARVPMLAEHPDMVWLNTVSVYAKRNMLYRMGLLITSPNDPRLWNFSRREELIDIGPANVDLSWPTPTGRNPYRRTMLRTPPIWILFNEPWNPVPVAQKESEKSEDNNEERSQEDNN